jgi:hypothetical protein
MRVRGASSPWWRMLSLMMLVKVLLVLLMG